MVVVLVNAADDSAAVLPLSLHLLDNVVAVVLDEHPQHGHAHGVGQILPLVDIVGGDKVPRAEGVDSLW